MLVCQLLRKLSCLSPQDDDVIYEAVRPDQFVPVEDDRVQGSPSPEQRTASRLTIGNGDDDDGIAEDTRGNPMQAVSPASLPWSPAVVSETSTSGDEAQTRAVSDTYATSMLAKVRRFQVRASLSWYFKGVLKTHPPQREGGGGRKHACDPQCKVCLNDSAMIVTVAHAWKAQC